MTSQMRHSKHLYYGWYIVIAAAVINVFFGSIMIYGVTAMVTPIYLGFGWSYAHISLAMTIRGFENGALNPAVGYFIDRVSARKLMFAGTFIGTLGLLLLSQVTSLLWFYISFFIITIGTSLTSHIVPSTVIVRWFRENVSKATSVFSIGMGIGALAVPVIAWALDSFGWQIVIKILAGIVLIVGLPLSAVFRDRPENSELQDIGRHNHPFNAEEQDVQPIQLTTKEALKTRTFWQIGISMTLWVAGISAYSLHIMPYLESIGISRTLSSIVAMAVPISSLPVRIIFGFLADRLTKKYVSSIAIAITGLGLITLNLVDSHSPVLIVLFIILFAIGLGGVTPIGPPLNKEYFGTKNFGQIYGIGGLFFTVGLAATPPIVGYVYDKIGHYGSTWLVLGILTLLGAIVMYALPKLPVCRVTK